MRSLLALLLLGSSSWTLGSLAVRGRPGDEPRDARALRHAAGLGLAALLLGVLALAGALHAGPAVLAALSVPALVAAVRSLRSAPPAATPDGGGSRAFTRTTLLVLGLASLGAIAPVTEDDSLSATLPVAQRLVAEGTWRFWPDRTYGVFPLSQELLVGTVLQVGGERPGVVCALEWALAALLLYGLGRRLGLGRGSAAAALLLALGCPAATFLAASTKEDLLLLVETLAAAYALVAFDGARRASLAGLFAGLAAGAKVPGLAVVLGVVVALAASGRGTRRRDAALALGWAALAGGLWYGVNVARFGNPVPPFLSPPLHTFLSPSAQAATVHRLAAPSALFAGGRGNLLNPLALLGLVALLSRDARRRHAPLLAMAGVYAVVWTLGVPNPRLLLPAAALLAVPAAELLARATARPLLGPLARAAVAASAGVIVLIAGLRLVRYLSSPSTFLARETQAFVEIDWMNRHLDPARHRVATTFRASAYLAVPWLVLDPTYQAEISPDEVERPDELIAALRRRGVTHVFAGIDEVPPGLEERLTLVREAAARLGGTTLLREPRSVTTRLYELTTSGRVPGSGAAPPEGAAAAAGPRRTPGSP